MPTYEIRSVESTYTTTFIEAPSIRAARLEIETNPNLIVAHSWTVGPNITMIDMVGKAAIDAWIDNALDAGHNIQPERLINVVTPLYASQAMANMAEELIAYSLPKPTLDYKFFDEDYDDVFTWDPT